MENRHQVDPKDELVRKFANKMRRAMQTRDNFVVPLKSVKFNPETMETSIGGTETHGNVKVKSVDDTMSSILSTSSSILESPSANTAALKPPSPATRRRSEIPIPVREITASFERRSTGEKQDSQDVKMNETPKHELMNRFSRRHTLEQATPECFNPVSFETPALLGKHRRTLSAEFESQKEDDCSSMTVAVRVRPFSKREINEHDRCVISITDSETVVSPDTNNVTRFTYDYSFWSFDKLGGHFADQEYVYNSLAQPLLVRAFEGYNVCLFAYGQTGSGKSYSIMGHGEEVGIIPRFCEELFGRVESCHGDRIKVNVEISFFEIYNEKIHDLLGPLTKDRTTGKRQTLKVREHPLLGPFVEGLSSYVVKSFDDVNGWLNVGNKHRATAATGMNDKSSRSHSVFTMFLTQTRKYRPRYACQTDTLEGEDHEHSITSKINLVDLAGSERQSLAMTSGERLREGASINKSLHTLGKVISLLSVHSSNNNKKKKKVYIPYRDSILTWLLKESLGGNSKTAMLATISPSSAHVEETLSTLRYAKQARTIINLARVNEDPKAKLIRELRMEIDRLRSQTGIVSEDVIGASLAEIHCLRQQLTKKEREMDEMTKSWQDKLKRSELRKAEEARQLEKSGVSFKVDNSLPNLVNLNEDPQLSEMLLYMLKEGQTMVGRLRDNSQHDIQLNGPLIADNHCGIHYVDKVVTISPIGDAPTYVNGNLITSPTVLCHSDRVILGGNHYFRFNNPNEVQKGRKSLVGQQGHLRDFEYAQQELIRVQDAPLLQAELDDAKKRHQEELERQKEEATQQMKEQLEKKKMEADSQLLDQRAQFEDRLSELERHLEQYRRQNQESEQDRAKAKDMIRKLEKQKTQLEDEVRTNRQKWKAKVETQTATSQKVAEESREKYLKVVDQLAAEKLKILRDVERLEQIRRQRSQTATPRLTPAIPMQDFVKKNLYRTALIVREANKICQHLGRDTVFTREDVADSCGEGSGGQQVIRVTNNTLGMSTFWSLEKLESRLVQMRDIYQAAEEASVEDIDEVFADPNDNWESSTTMPGSVTPKLLNRQRRRSTRASLAVRLTFNQTPTCSPASGSHSGTPGTSVGSPVKEEEEAMETSSSSSENGLPVVGFCRDLVSLSLDRFKGEALQEGLSDKILCHCELLRLSVTNMAEAYTSASMSPSGKAQYLNSDNVHVNSIQLSGSVQTLLSLCSLWIRSYINVVSEHIQDLCRKITHHARKMVNQIVLFLQGCENDVEGLVDSSVTSFHQCLATLAKFCGELALTTEASMACLQDPPEDVQDEDEVKVKLSNEVRQAFVSGCDVFVDKTLQGGLKTVEDCELKIQCLLDETHDSKVVSDVMGEVAVVTSSCKILLEKCQRVQVELDSTMTETCPVSRTDQYYQRSYVRALGVISHVKGLTGATSMLSQAAEALRRGPVEAPLQRVHSCADKMQRATIKLLLTSHSDPITCDKHDTSILTDNQMEALDVAAEELRTATIMLMSRVKEVVDEDMLCSLAPSKRAENKDSSILSYDSHCSSSKIYS